MSDLRQLALRAIRRHFPSGIYPEDQAYTSTEEHQRLRAAQAAVDMAPFEGLLEAVREAYPAHYIDDRRRTLLHDPSLIVSVTATPHEAEAGELHFVVACISIIAPLYWVFSSIDRSRVVEPVRYDRVLDDASELGAFLERQVRQRFEAHLLVPAIGHEVVPDVAVGNLDLGSTTIYDAIFSPDR